MFKAIEGIRIEPISWLKAAVYTCAVLLVYSSLLKWMIFIDWTREDYQYCIFIPFIVLYLLWERHKKLATTASHTSYYGFIFLGIGILFYWIGELGGEYFTMYLSLWLVLVSIIWINIGWEKIKVIEFPMVFILTMFPFPFFINTKINFQLRLISSKLGVWLLHLFGMSAYREGNVIDLGFTKLQVVDACSGLNYVTSLLILALLLTYWFKAHIWKKAVLFLSSIPLAIFFNSFRITITAVLFKFFGAEVAEGFFHGFSGWIVFICALAVLLLEMGVLKRIGFKGSRSKGFKGKEDEELTTEINDLSQRHGVHKDNFIQGEGTAETSSLSAYAEASSSPEAAADRSARQAERHKEHGEEKEGFKGSRGQGFKGLLKPTFFISVAILLITFGLSHGIEFREKVPISKSLSTFPKNIGIWDGEGSEMEEAIIDELDLSDYVIINYRSPEGKIVNFYVAYYESQRKGESIHSPESCLPGSGWEFKDAGNIKISIGEDPSLLTVNRSYIEKAGEKELVYYWFPMRGRILTNIYQMKIYNFWDALTRQRTDGALVRVITPIYEGEEIKVADERLAGFVKEVEPVLAEYLPGE